MQDIVSFEIHHGIAVVELKNPPVNALSVALRASINDALGKAEEDEAVRGVVLTAKGKIFVAGADITEFGKPPKSPTLVDVINRLRHFPKPVVAAINGVALGGGAELALSCHARIGAPDARIGLPEINLGLIPGAGGLQFLPAIIGAAQTLELASGGKPLSAKTALEKGLISAIADGDLVEVAIAHATALADKGAIAAPDLNSFVSSGDMAAFEAAVQKARKTAAGNPGIDAMIDVMRAGFSENFDANLQTTRRSFEALVEDDRSKAMRYAFFAERAAAKVDVAKEQLIDIKRVAIIGAGTMGTGIAMACVNGGFPVTIIETNGEALERGLTKIRLTYQDLVKRGRMTAAEGERHIGAVHGVIGLEHVKDADLIIEAVFEKMEVKQEIFGQLDKLAKQGAILATNTSYLDVNIIAATTRRPQDVIGLHFFSPANIMRLLEVVRAAKTSPVVLGSCVNFARKIGKVPVVVGVCHGFVGNRMFARRTAAAEKLLQDGALPHQVDKALTDFGFRMGPLAVGDLAGLDIGWNTRKATGQVSPIADSLCEEGRFGQKAGKGYYLYKDGARIGERDPAVEKLIVAVSAKLGITRREIDDEEIVERLVYPMINEAARILEEGIAAKPSDIDVIWLNGYGWPVWRGGPVYYGDHVGLAHIAERLEHYAKVLGDETLHPAPLLLRLAKEGRSFEENAGC